MNMPDDRIDTNPLVDVLPDIDFEFFRLNPGNFASILQEQNNYNPLIACASRARFFPLNPVAFNRRDRKSLNSRYFSALSLIRKGIQCSDWGWVIGGLELLKDWLVKRQHLFSKEAVQQGLPIPKGILIMGVSGCGKSLSAKVVSSLWGVPLFRLDMNLVFSGLYGTPEAAFEHAMRTVEAVAPVVLWVDEIENGLYYETMPQIWKGIATLAASEKIQVFATTHSRECLIAAHETMKAMPSYDFALHRLQQVNGRLEAVTHDQGMLEVALNSGLEVR